MKTMIQIVLVALIVGGASAGGSFYWHLKQAKSEPAATEPEKTDEKDHPGSETASNTDAHDDADHHADASPDSLPDDVATSHPSKKETSTARADIPADYLDLEPPSFGPPAGVRPPWDRDGDEAGILISDLRARAAVTSKQERRMAQREEAMNLIVEDLRIEQANAARLRKQLAIETNRTIRAAQEAHREVYAERAAMYRAAESERAKMREEQIAERKSVELQIQKLQKDKDDAESAAENAMKVAKEEQDELRRQLEDAKKPAELRDRSGSPEEAPNLKKLITVMDSMPVENSAELLKDFVDKGRTEAVVVVLDGMQPKKTAKVLSLIKETEPSLASDLLDKLKKLKGGKR